MALNPLEQYKASRRRSARTGAGRRSSRKGFRTNSARRLEDFSARWRDAGGGDIVVRQDAGPSPLATTPTPCAPLRAAVEFLEFKGVPSTQIRQQRYDASDPKAPIIAIFSAVRSEPCPIAPSVGTTSRRPTGANGPSKHLGCAVTSQSGGDGCRSTRAERCPLRALPSDNSRRTVILGKYRDGKVTSSDKDEQASGTVSTAVKQ